jgi:hypothetical protein
MKSYCFIVCRADQPPETIRADGESIQAAYRRAFGLGDKPLDPRAAFGLDGSMRFSDGHGLYVTGGTTEARARALLSQLRTAEG